MTKPIKLNPVLKDYIWGGNKLKTEYGKVSDLSRAAESWELSCHPDGLSIIADGEYAGRTLTEYLKARSQPPVSILLKLIDAADNLSLQVHPNDLQAKKYNYNENGKTEMWYIIDHEPGAEIIYGFKREITQAEFKKRIGNNTLLDIVNRVKVKKGGVFFIPAGTLHAIGKGILIAEIQQSSNLTYRVYDYGRTDADGKPRDLHIEEAVQVTSLRPPPEPYNLSECEYFKFIKLDIKEAFIHQKKSGDSRGAILVLDGEINADGCVLKKGETAFIPHEYGNKEISLKGAGQVIIVYEKQREFNI